MPPVNVTKLEIHPTTGIMRAATFGRSAFEVNTDFPIDTLIGIEGKIRLLRVHDVGTGFGPPRDSIDVEVVVQLDNQPEKAFGFQLRTDANEDVRCRLLKLLRDAFNRNKRVCVEYVRTGLRTGRILRVINLI